MKFSKLVWLEITEQLKEHWRGKPIAVIGSLIFVLLISAVRVTQVISYGNSANSAVFWYWYILFMFGSVIVGYNYSPIYKMLPLTGDQLKSLLFFSTVGRTCLLGFILSVTMLPGAIVEKNIFLVFYTFGMVLLYVPMQLYTKEKGFVNFIDEKGERKELIPLFQVIFQIFISIVCLFLFEQDVWQLQTIATVLVYVFGSIGFILIWRRLKRCPADKLQIGYGNSPTVKLEVK